MSLIPKCSNCGWAYDNCHCLLPADDRVAAAPAPQCSQCLDTGFVRDAVNELVLCPLCCPAPQAEGTDAEIARYNAMICVVCGNPIGRETCIWDASVWRHVKCAAPEPQAEGEKLWCTNCCTILTDKDNYMDDMYLCQNCGSACKRVGAAPAETAGPPPCMWPINSLTICNLPVGHSGEHSGTPVETGETAGEMTADAELDTMVRDFCAVGPKPKSEVRSRILAFAKPRVEQAERQLRELRVYFDQQSKQVADLERERDTARETSKELNRRNGALQHTLNTLTDRNVWYGYYKAAMSLFGWEEEKREAAESELREMREAAEKLVTKLRRIFDSEEYKGIFTIAHIHGCKYDGENCGEELTDLARLLARKAGS